MPTHTTRIYAPADADFICITGFDSPQKQTVSVSTPKECSKVNPFELLPCCDQRTDAKSENWKDNNMIEPHGKSVLWYKPFFDGYMN